MEITVKVVSGFSGDHLGMHFGKQCILGAWKVSSSIYLKEIIDSVPGTLFGNLEIGPSFPEI